MNSIKTTPSSSPIDIIRTIFGSNVTNSLLSVDYGDEALKFSMNGFITKGDYSGKKRQFLLFINHRLVESKSLKKAIFDDVYNSIFPSSVQPFVYMSLEMDPTCLDVNVSPTKNEVNFLNEDAIVEKVKAAVEEKLLEVNETRKLYTQQLLPGASVVAEKSFEERTYPKDMVRTDSNTQSIVKYFQQDSSSQSPNASQIIKSPGLNRSKSKKFKMTTQLSSINKLRDEVAKCHDEGLRSQIEKLKFVGVANKSQALIQCDNILYLCDTQRLCLELFYQQAIDNFEDFDGIEFVDPIDIEELSKIGFDMKECNWQDEDGPKDQLANRVKIILMEQREMLRAYFNITINDVGELEKLPSIVPSFMPLMSHLPVFIIRLACDINYDDEEECFKAICQELASFYSKLSLTATRDDLNLLAETIIFPAIKQHLLPPKSFLTDGTFMKLTSLQELYKVFERC